MELGVRVSKSSEAFLTFEALAKEVTKEEVCNV